MTIVITKLISGEEIIADEELVRQEQVAISVLRKPCVLMTVQTEQGYGMQLVPFMPYAKDHTVPIPCDMILTQVEPTAEMRNKYNSMFGTGIQVPETDKIIVA